MLFFGLDGFVKTISPHYLVDIGYCYENKYYLNVIKRCNRLENENNNKFYQSNIYPENGQLSLAFNWNFVVFPLNVKSFFFLCCFELNRLKPKN